MNGPSDLPLEGLRAVVLAGLIGFLIIRQRHSRFAALPGARLIVAGFSLLLFATLLDMTDEIDGLEDFVVIGATQAEAYIETIFGYLAAFFTLFLGFMKIIPSLGKSSEINRELRESEEKFRSVFETIPDMVGITRLSDNKVITLNPAFEELTAIPRTQMIGHSSLDMNFWADPSDREHMVKGVLEHGLVRNLEARINTGDGVARESLISARLLTLQGEPHILSIFKDITESKQVQAALRESEERYRTLFSSSPDPVWIIDQQRFVECNQAAIDILGYPDGDSLKNTHPSELSPELQPDGEPSYSKAERMMLIAKEKGIHRFEWVHRRRDQTDFFAEVTLSALTLQGRQVLYCTWRDITERKRVEEGLRESESRYRRLHESMSDAFARVDMQGHLVEVNKAFQSMLGYSQDELLQLSFRELTPECWHAAEARIIAEQVLTRGHSDVYEKEYRRRDDTIIPVELRTFLLTDDDGQPAGMWAIVRDISEQKAVLKTLQDSEIRFRQVFESSPVPLIIARGDGGGILAVNREFVAQTGITAEQAQGKNSIELGLWNNPENREDFLSKVFAEGQVDNMEAEFRLKDNQIRNGLTSAKLIDLAGEKCILIDIRDITKQKQAESVLLEMDRMKSEFISTAAHELRTPLTTILGYTELLSTPETFGGFSKELCAEFLNEIYLKGETLSRIIDEMLDISRIESGHPITLTLEAIDPKQWLSKVTRRFELQRGPHGFVLELSGQQPEAVVCDLHRMTQVLENLLSNAVKYSPHGGTITVTAGIDENDYVVKVADQGIGMTTEQVSKVFDKFYRADNSNTAIGGLGLGMSIARQIVENHGGRIWVESAVGKGTIAGFALPLNG